MKKIATSVVFLLVLFIAYLLLWPVAVDPVAWQAPKAPTLTQSYAVNNRLASLKRVATGVGVGPESIAIDHNGNLYTGYEDGRIVRFDAQGQHADTITNTRGRPLGMAISSDGTLLVADASKGLLAVNVDNGAVTQLTNEANGVAFKFTDDLDIATDGQVYFTDASSKFGPALKARDDIIEHGAHGRLLQYNPNNKTTRVLLDGLQFANGVALSKNEDFVLVTETGNYDIVRYWLKGPKAGSHDVFFHNLPGIPDGISSNRDGTFWVALFTTRNATLDALSAHPFLRKVAFRLPQLLQPQPAHHAFVLGLNEDGEVTNNLQDPSPNAFAPITSVTQHGNKLYLGSLERDNMAFYSLTPQATH